MAMRSVLLGVAVAVGAGAGAGCGPELDPGSRITHTRVLGARIQAGGDPSRVWPRPDEPVEITWLVVGPGETPRPFAWEMGIRACAAGSGGSGGEDPSRCADRPATSTFAGAGDGATLPRLSFTTPTAAALAAAVAGSGESTATADRLVVTGVICAGGPVADAHAPPWSRCATEATDGGGAVDETDIQLTVRLQLGEAGNAPPTLGDDPVAIDGAAWAADASPAEGAAEGLDPGAGIPSVLADGEEHPVTVLADAADREPGEALQLSAFATAGRFDSQFTGVAAGDTAPATSMKLAWTPPAASEIPAAGRTVRFVLVLRDLRGGVDWQTRTLRLVPPPAP
jgi:hypothetical protein